MIFELEETGNEALFPPIEQAQPRFGERFAAAAEAERIRLNSWNRRGAIEAEFRDDILRQLSPESLGPNRVDTDLPELRMVGNTGLFDAVQDAFRGVPDDFIPDIPMTQADLDARVRERLQAEWTEARDVLDLAPEGSWGPEMMGAMWAGLQDEATLAILPFGMGAGSLGRVAAREFALGVAWEGMTLPRQFDMADELGIGDPQILRQLLISGAASAVLGTGITAALRGIGGWNNRQRLYDRTAEADGTTRSTTEGTPREQDEAISAAMERMLRDGETGVGEPVVPPAPRDAPGGAAAALPDEPLVPRSTFDQAGMQPEALTALARLEQLADSTFTINSAIRSPEVNAAVGGARNSQHLAGSAVDIDVRGMPTEQRVALIRQAREAGFGGVGVYENSLHFDVGQVRHWGPSYGAESLPGWASEAVATPRGQSARPSAPPPFSAFDFSPAGNASPETNRVGYVYGQLIGQGVEPHIAAGIVGNLMVESGPTISPSAIGDGGAALGIAQWNTRRSALEAFAASRGTAATDLDTQIAFMFREFETTEAGAWSQIRAARTPQEAAELFSRLYERPGTPHLERRVEYATDVYGQYQGGAVPAFRRGAAGADTGSPGGPTSRGYTGEGQVTAGDDIRIDVDYEIVDASLLRGATDDLQPRDRSRPSSDEQIAEIAARLDPNRLLPAAEADRGAPVIGPDNIIESGNGRVQAIVRAAERHPDRYQAYRDRLTELGYTIPADVERPVLVARRRTEFTPDERRRFVRQANTSAVARMSPTERAAMDASALTDDIVRLYDGAAKLTGDGNAAFTRRFLDSLPQAERSGLVDRTGALNTEGVARIRAALLARAFDAPDILARVLETDAGELRSFVVALERAAPDFAALRADIAAGRVRPEMDISGHVLDAMRLIATAREISAREAAPVARVIEDLLEDIDLLEGAVAPLTAALVKRFQIEGRARPADNIAAFLTRYATEARKVGGTEAQLFGDVVGPLDVLRAIEPEGFGHLVETGMARTVEAPRPRAPLDDPAARAAFDDGALGAASQRLDDEMIRSLRADLDAANSAVREAGIDDLELKLPDGGTVTVREILDDLDDDLNLDAVLGACGIGRAG